MRSRKQTITRIAIDLTSCALTRKESAKTQADAFANIFRLVTRYPGLRQLFIRFKSTQNEVDYETPETTETLWTRDEEEIDRNWDFRMKLAAFCVSNNELASLLESVRPSELGLVTSSDLGFVEKLLSRFCV